MAENLKALVKRMAEEKGLGEYWPVIDWMVQNESTWDQGAHNTKDEDSVGLFQLNRAGGLGAGKSVEYLKNPQNNAEIALSNIAASLQGGASLQQALRPWSVTHGVDVNKIAGGVTAAGGVTMANGTANTKLQQLFDEIDRLMGSDDPRDRSDALYYLGQMPASILTSYYGVEGETAQAPSQQEVAISQQALDIALANAQANMQKIGLEASAKQFANEISALQEGRDTAEYAMDYARQMAPPGMTTLPGTGPESGRAQLFGRVGWDAPAALPLGPAPAGGPFQALQQAQQFVPQAPNLQFQAPALPQAAPQLAGMGGAALPMGTGGDISGMASSIAQAMRMLFGQVEGMLQPGAQLPIGG